ncbi:uncharacterized protein I303_102080 [Kwoniella dejecticola CBS 10117]|uniref:Uncharacterized protein n=1 Tax=Kwoniella dejecticola CBS 10117 TaxID=1296121 RepID=A0A1A6ABX6_9TREE|nr:uncharacterized protein I303_01779 [Kwoniella dejecticola CBS 10117]OBR87571.1 hypothetical protein I303_01779 [Kwoniella dejecticola CBS 10117]
MASDPSKTQTSTNSQTTQSQDQDQSRSSDPSSSASRTTSTRLQDMVDEYLSGSYSDEDDPLSDDDTSQRIRDDLNTNHAQQMTGSSFDPEPEIGRERIEQRRKSENSKFCSNGAKSIQTLTSIPEEEDGIDTMFSRK